MTQLNKWRAVDEDAGIFEASYKLPGFIARTVAIRLKSGGFLLYSAGAGLIDSFEEELMPLGKPEILVAPNSFHHMGIPAWRKKFPNVRVVAHSNAMKRLRSRGCKDLEDIDTIISALPEGMAALTSDNSKVGEIMFLVKTGRGNVWIACDTFFNLPRVPKAFPAKLISRVTDNAPGLKISKLLTWFGVRDKDKLKDWLLSRLEQDNPVKLIVSHGDNLEGSDLEAKIRACVADRLG